MRQAEPSDGSSDVQRRQPDPDEDAASDVVFQLQIIERIHSIDVAQVEPHGSEPENHADAQLEHRIRQRLLPKRGCEPRINDIRPYDPAEMKHRHIYDERSGATTIWQPRRLEIFTVH